MKKLKTRLVLRRETLAGLNADRLGRAAGGALVLPFSWQGCPPSGRICFGSYQPCEPIVV